MAEINALIVRSKSHWNWPAGYLDQAISLLLITPAYLRAHLCFEISSGQDETVAFFAVDTSGEQAELDHLWVTPDLIRTGLGRMACNCVFELARDKRWPEIRVLPDPMAEAFYLRMGFHDTGRRVPSRVPGGPVFSVYCWSAAGP